MKMVFNSLFKQSFNHILEVVRSMETELAMSHAAIVEVAVRSFGSKVTGASPGSNPRTSWWTTKVKWAVKLKKETYKVWLSCGTPKADSYQQAKWPVVRVVTEVKTWVWKEFGEAMEQDFWQARKKF